MQNWEGKAVSSCKSTWEPRNEMLRAADNHNMCHIISAKAFLDSNFNYAVT